LQAALAGAIVVAMAALIAQRWDEVRLQSWQVAPAPLALSVVLVVGAILLWAVVWGRIVRQLGAAETPTREIASVYLYGNLARYLPGAVWNFLARAYLGHRLGIGQRRIWTATVLDLTVAVATGLLLYAATVAGGAPAVVSPLLVAGCALALFALMSPPTLRLVDRATGGRAGVTKTFGWRAYGAYVLVSGVVWAGIGVAFFFFVAGLYPVEPTFVLPAIGLWSLSVVAGLIAVGIPQGLGVKEGLLAFGLSAAVPGPVALALALASRLWLVGCDVLAVGLWWCLDRVRSARKRPHGGTGQKPAAVRETAAG
jgi:hypothetical protein